MADESDWLSLARHGDSAAFGLLLKMYLPRLRSLIAGQIAPVWRAHFDEDDVLQITGLEAFLSLASFHGVGPEAFFSWLRRIAENNLRDAIEELQALKRPNPRMRLQPGTDDSYVTLFNQLGGTSTTPSKQAARAEAKIRLLEATAKLPEDYRTVVLLYDLQELAVGDVSDRMGRSAGAVFMLRARAHERLREMLGTASRVLPDTR